MSLSVELETYQNLMIMSILLQCVPLFFLKVQNTYFKNGFLRIYFYLTKTFPISIKLWFVFFDIVYFLGLNLLFINIQDQTKYLQNNNNNNVSRQNVYLILLNKNHLHQQCSKKLETSNWQQIDCTTKCTDYNCI